MADTNTYTFNAMLVRSLLNFMPVKDQGHVRGWLQLLDDMSKSSTELSERADYVWYLLKCMECGSLSSPFNEPPPARTNMKPLYEVLPTAVYEEVVKKATPSMKWLDELACHDDISGVEKGVSPTRFFPTQPIPRYGTICYGCVFGPQKETTCL